jgi:hypothetical protein
MMSLLTLSPSTLALAPLGTFFGLIYSYAIAPKHLDQDGKIRIEVFNPCDGGDDQKTPTTVLFDDDGNFLEFGINALQKYAEII